MERHIGSGSVGHAAPKIRQRKRVTQACYSLGASLMPHACRKAPALAYFVQSADSKLATRWIQAV